MSNIVSLVIYPDIRLKTKSTNVTEFDDLLRQHLSNMEKATQVFCGWGLAGVQIGYMKRMIYINHDAIVGYENRNNNRNDALRGSPLFMINPQILERSDEEFTSTEGCLSLPSLEANVKRSKSVKAKYQDEFGTEHTIETDIPLLAACIQHEIDHINGITLAEHQSPLKRSMMIKRIEKFIKSRNPATKVDLNKLCNETCSHEHHSF